MAWFRCWQVLAFLVLGLSCADASKPPSGDSPEEALIGLESRLLRQDVIQFRYRIQSTGAFEANISGRLELRGGDVVTLAASGVFGGDPVELSLAAAAGEMNGGNAHERFAATTPQELRKSITIGLTRMGILHNLARLTAAQPPDHAAAGVEDWVKVIDVGDAPVEGAPRGAARGLAFGIQVAGERAGEAVLWLDGAGLPLLRTQQVQFPGGQMHVTEEYEFVGLR